jgi:geranylgeranyl diphosphate synthase type II
MYTHQELYAIFSEHLKNQSFSRDPKELYEPITYALNQKGKRIRPILTLMACDLFGEDIHKALPQATALELLHNFTLIHDDIMDQSPLRHGVETVFKKWDSNMAILAGDTLYVLAYRYATQAQVDVLPAILDVFNETALEACEGQQKDLNFEKKEVVSKAEYLEMSRLKTAVLFGASLKIGAIVAKTSATNARLLDHFGNNMGLGFQVMDDLLDLYGDEKIFGKKNGMDIIENKKTFLFVTALELADGHTRENLLALYRDKQIAADEKIKRVKAIFDRLSIREITLQLIQDYYNKAMESLDEIDRPEEAKEPLRQLAYTLIYRKQ